MASKGIVKATKTKKFPYRNDNALNDKHLILANSEILVMRVQNESKLKVIAIFSQLSSEISIQDLKQDETFLITDMKFLPDSEQLIIQSGDIKSQNSQHKNILAIIDNQNRVYLMEIQVDYEKGQISSYIFADMLGKEQEDCKQIFWHKEQFMILKQGSLIIDRKLKLKNKSIIQKQQYLIGNNQIDCQRIVSGMNQQNKMQFYGISNDATRVFLNDKENQNLFLAIPLTIQSDLFDIYVSAYNDVIVLSKNGMVFALDSEKLDTLSKFNLKLEPDEVIIEAHMDNTQTSIFALTSKNQIYHVFLQKVNLRNGQIETFKSKGILRFHQKNIIFTFRVLAIPESQEQCIFKTNENNLQIQNSFLNFKPNPQNAKYIIYSLLVQEDNMKIFSVDLTTHDLNFQDSDIENEFPIAYLNQFGQQQAFNNPSGQYSIPPIQNSAIPIYQNETITSTEQTPTVRRENQTPQSSSQSKQMQSNNKYLEEQASVQEKNISKNSNIQDINEHKSLSKPVNPSILPLQQDPILGMQQMQYYFEQQQQQLQQQMQTHTVQSKDHSSHSQYASHEQKEVKKKNQIRTLTNQNDYPLQDDQQQKEQHSHHSHSQHQEQRGYLDDAKDSRINQIFQDNTERITSKLDEYFDKKFNKLEAIVSSKIEKIRKEDDIINLVEKSTSSSKEKMEIFLKEEIENQYKNYVEQNMKTYMIEVFQQVTKNFERGQKFYTDKIQQEKEKCKIQNENSDEILSIVKKITGPFSESTIIHKKILGDIITYSNEKKTKMDQLEKQLSQLVTKQDMIVSRIQTMEKTLQEEMSTQKLQKLVESSVSNNLAQKQSMQQSIGSNKTENVTVQNYPIQKKSFPVDVNSPYESGGDNQRKKQQQQQQQQQVSQYKKKVQQAPQP